MVQTRKPARAEPAPVQLNRFRVPGCPFCERHPKDGPAHDASPLCTSGKRAHCTCDTCF